jgi:hypothetical protein
MYFGRPVIATGYSGNLDFMREDTGYLVKYDMTPIGPGCWPYPIDGQWAEPDLEHAGQLMRVVFDKPEGARETGARAAAAIRASHSATAAGWTMRRRLEVIARR